MALAVVWADHARAQTADSGAPPNYSGPPAPLPPALAARDAEGRITLRAVRVDTPLNIDGQIDEAAYQDLEPISDFIQMEPAGGQPATEKTEIWLFFDQRNFYVTIRAWESQPDRMIANEMRRDSNNIRQGDCIGFSLDTFYDRRNAFQFEVNPLGARTDGQSTNERQYSADWNPVWDLAVGRFQGGWTLEAAIPFKSLRYRPGRAQIWGFNARRNNKWKNEISYLNRIPPAMGMGRGDFSASLYATVVGIDAPAGSKNLEVKPYGISELTTDLGGVTARHQRSRRRFRRRRQVRHHPEPHRRLHLQHRLRAGGSRRAAGQPDPVQPAVSGEARILPGERRDVRVRRRRRQPDGRSGDVPILFYSRRIGLHQNREIPIAGGGRMTGRIGRFSLGMLNMQTREEPDEQVPVNQLPTPSTNFSVIRVKQDILRRSSVGAILTNRSVAQNGFGSNQTYGLDAGFAFYSNLFVNAYWAKTRTEGLDGDDTSYRGQLDYIGDRYGVQLERMAVGDNFNPEVGFVRRDNMRRSLGRFRFSPRPASIPSIRKFSWQGTVDYIEDGAGALETRDLDGEFAIEFQNSDRFSVGITDNYERLLAPFPIAPGVRIPVGEYDFVSGRAAFTFGQQRPFSGNVAVERGRFYDGDLTPAGFSRSRVNVTASLLARADRVDQLGRSADRLVHHQSRGSRVTYTVTPLMFVSALSSTTPAPTWWVRTCASGGSISRAASSSWSTTTSATASRVACRTCGTGRSS